MGKDLEAYRNKRSAQRSPEPFGAGTSGRSRLFVVQQHAARRMHYDLRLELGGVLLSWAVPKGPAFDPQVKRLALQVEEHPLDYAEFEGLIPEGNYGAGAVIVWDRGRWDPIEDPTEGLRKGKLLFDLWGYKLRGRWTLFRTKGEPNQWLLVKKPDGYADPDAEPPAESILSGLTVEQLRDGVDPAVKLRARLRRKKVPRDVIEPGPLPLMLAEVAEAPFSRAGWIFELKYDGYRLVARKDAGEAQLFYRRGSEVTERFPEVSAAVRALPFDGLVLDGELVVLDASGRPDFQRLQQRVQLRRTSDIARSIVRFPVSLCVFDILACEGHDLRTLPLIERKRVLREVLPPVGALRYCDHIEEQGSEMFEEVSRLGLEGILAKKADSPYVAARSSAWLKIRADQRGDFAVAGFTRPKSSRSGFGALHLAVHDGAGFVYAGRVGSGFSDLQLDEIRDRLDGSVRADPVCSGAPVGDEHVWVDPELVCEVRYKQWTDAGHLRQPVCLGVHDDRPVESCRRSAGTERVSDPPSASPVEPESRTLSFTNLGKVFWPNEGYTKGDLIDYYRSVSKWLLPYLKDRPLVLTRYPDGIDGKNFFQKDAPGYIPDWIRTETLWSEHARREIHYFICEDEDTLLYLANLGTIPLHLWSSRFDDLQHPDWCILDLDPKDAPFEHVIHVAREIRKLCRDIGLEPVVKTSGSTGLHVLLPLGGRCTYEQSRQLAELLARVIAARLPDIATVARALAARQGRVYIDFVQNGHGRLLVAPYSVRPLPGAPVSAPLRWSEVKRGLAIGRYTIRSLPERLRRQRNDPLRPVLSGSPDLEGCLAMLAERLSGPAR